MKAKVLILFLLSLLLAGCAKNNTASTNTANHPNSPDPTNANMTTPMNANTNSQNPTTTMTPPQVQDPTRSGQPPTEMKVPAPDNSEITVYMNPKDHSVTETRVFKDNPLISKMVRFTDAKLNRSAKVYDKKGGARELPKELIEAANVLSAEQLAMAVKLIPPKPETPNPEKEQKKKEMEQQKQDGGTKEKGNEEEKETPEKTNMTTETVTNKSMMGGKKVGAKTLDSLKKTGNKTKGASVP